MRDATGAQECQQERIVGPTLLVDGTAAGEIAAESFHEEVDWQLSGVRGSAPVWCEACNGHQRYAGRANFCRVLGTADTSGWNASSTSCRRYGGGGKLYRW